MLVALYFLPESNENINEKHREILKIWNRINFKTNLEEPLKYHFPDHGWELKRE